MTASRPASTRITPPATPTSAAERRRAMRLYRLLEVAYPDAHCALHHRNAFELLVATILSAQCTDERVNKVTPALFAAYPTPRAMAEAPLKHLEELVRSTGFFRNKARNIQGAAIRITEAHNGQVPDTMENLLSLPGVARKTANVVLGNAFNINVGVVVDTHIGRIARRLKLTDHHDKNAVMIERDLMGLFPPRTWTQLAHLLIAHGRTICKARTPDCDRCPLGRQCCFDR